MWCFLASERTSRLSDHMHTAFPQTSHLLGMLCDRPATARKAVEELGLHNTLAQVLPRVRTAAGWEPSAATAAGLPP